MSPATEKTTQFYFENGECLTREEFHRIYEKMPGVKAELINGVVYVNGAYDARRQRFMASPVRAASHSEPHWLAAGWLNFYALDTPGVWGGDNGTLKLPLAENEEQPDLYLRILAECGGQCRVGDDDYIDGTPELIIEIAASSKGIDLGPKKLAYLENGVREYVVWCVRDEKVEWFVRQDQEFMSLNAVNGILRSTAFPGLWLDVAGLVRKDIRAVNAAVRLGVATPEHNDFVRRLESASVRYVRPQT